MSLNLQPNASTILYLPLKDEQLPNLDPHTTLKQTEHAKIKEIDSNTFDVVTGITKLSYSPSFLSELSRVLKPGGIMMIQIGKECPLKKSLLYSGFTEISSKQQSEVNHVCNPSNHLIKCKDKFESNNKQWTARKPKVEMKAASLKLKSKQTNSNKVEPKQQKWSLGMNDMMDADIDLIEEDTLLDHEEEEVVIPNTNLLDDCGTGIGSSRKPCKDCTCGRKEKYDNEQQEKKQKKGDVKMYNAKTSACGSCHLGDAFRCGGCPYLGQPAFDPNSNTVKLQL